MVCQYSVVGSMKGAKSAVGTRIAPRHPWSPSARRRVRSHFDAIRLQSAFQQRKLPMTRIITVAAAQMGPIQRADSRKAVIGRLLALLRQAAEHKCNLVVFPELALTTFFPRWWMTD